MLHAFHSMLGYECHVYALYDHYHNASSGGAHICDSVSHMYQSCDIITCMTHAVQGLHRLSLDSAQTVLRLCLAENPAKCKSPSPSHQEKTFYTWDDLGKPGAF